jgi:hypothetical protein
MIGVLPRTVTVDGEKYPVRTDFRACLLIMRMFSDDDMSPENKFATMLELFYIKQPDDKIKAVESALSFLDYNSGSGEPDSSNAPPPLRLMDWEQDEQLYFAAIAKVAGRDIRMEKYVHWWTFLGYYMSIDGESVFSTVLTIREKLKIGKKLSKEEQEYYVRNRSMVDLKKDARERDDILAQYLGD